MQNGFKDAAGLNNFNIREEAAIFRSFDRKSTIWQRIQIFCIMLHIYYYLNRHLIQIYTTNWTIYFRKVTDGEDCSSILSRKANSPIDKK